MYLSPSHSCVQTVCCVNCLYRPLSLKLNWSLRATSPSNVVLCLVNSELSYRVCTFNVVWSRNLKTRRPRLGLGCSMNAATATGFIHYVTTSHRAWILRDFMGCHLLMLSYNFFYSCGILGIFTLVIGYGVIEGTYRSSFAFCIIIKHVYG
jgi:hypothetical protein